MEFSSRKGGGIVWIFFFLVFVGAGAGLVWWWGSGSESGSLPAFQTAEVERGNVIQTILTTGKLNPIRTVQVGSQISGNIMELLADFNSPVREGQVIARLDPSTYKADVALARAELERTQAGFDHTRLQWERVLQLHKQNLVPDMERDQVEVHMRQAAADVDIRRYILQKAELQLDRCTIVSPVNGTIISRNVDVGQTVAASLSAPVLFTIAEDLTRMKINSDVSEADIGRVRERQRVEYQVDAYRGQIFSGSVLQVRNAPQMISDVVTYDAVVQVDNPDLLLKPGMTAEVRFVTDERENVLRLRNVALRTRLPAELLPPDPIAAGSPERENQRTVYCLRDGRLEAVLVRTGISDGVYTEILEGLEEGEIVVTGLRLRIASDRQTGPSLLRGRQAQF